MESVEKDANWELFAIDPELPKNINELKAIAQKTNKWKKQTEELIKMTVRERWEYSLTDIKRRPW